MFNKIFCDKSYFVRSPNTCVNTRRIPYSVLTIISSFNYRSTHSYLIATYGSSRIIKGNYLYP